MCISNKGFEHLSSVSFIHSHMVDGMFQDGKENAPTAEDLTQYAEDNDLLVAKHILLLTKERPRRRPRPTTCSSSSRPSPTPPSWRASSTSS